MPPRPSQQVEQQRRPVTAAAPLAEPSPLLEAIRAYLERLS
ncbi:MAG: hypothetical protein ACOZQL_21370 [Myxococcota bacterium]